jgi:hypothetical protein
MISKGFVPSKLMMVFLISVFATSCSTNKRLHRKIVKSLKLQNSVILKLEKSRKRPSISKPIKNNKELKQAEGHLLMSLEIIRKSNQVIIRKLNVKKKGEPKDGN